MIYNSLPYFWNWFRRNRDQFNLAWKHSKDRKYLVMELNGYLQAYCKCLRCYVGLDDNEQSPRQLVITADGDPDYFDEAAYVVHEAPHIPGWQIMSLLPPVAPDWNLGWYFEEAPFTPWDVYIFATYRRKRGKARLELGVDYDGKLTEQMQQAAVQVAYNYVGEELFGSAVGEVSVKRVIDAPPEKQEEILALDMFDFYLQEFVPYLVVERDGSLRKEYPFG